MTDNHHDDSTAEARTRHARPVPAPLRMLRLGLRSLGRVSPTLNGRWAYWLWFRTHRFAEPGRELQWRNAAQQFTIDHPHGPIAVYSWGQGPPVLLLHGWSGRGTQLGAFAQPLVDAGLRAVAFDAPAHGRTPGKHTTLFRFADAMRAVAHQVGSPQGVIAHSFGAMVTAYALRTGLDAKRVVLISPPARLEFLIESFSRTLHIDQATQAVLTRLLLRRFGNDLANVVSTDSNARQLNTPALIIHDADDREVPLAQGEQLAQAWPGATLMRTTGLGHRRILRNPEAVNAAVKFLIDGVRLD